MKILYILDHYLNYHLDIVAELARELKNYDITVYVVSRKERDGENFYMFKQPPITEINNLKKIVDREKIDIIHSFSFGYSGLLAKYLSNQTKKTLFYTFLRDPYTDNTLVNNLISKYLNFLLKDSVLVLPTKINSPYLKPKYILPLGLNIDNYGDEFDNDLLIAFDVYNYKFLNKTSNINILIDHSHTLANLMPSLKIKIYTNNPRIYGKPHKNLDIREISKEFDAGIYYHGYQDQFIDLFMIKNMARGGKVVLSSKSPLSYMFDDICVFKDMKELPHKVEMVRESEQDYSKILEMYNIKKLAPLYKYAYSNL
ncbi:MAG: glycosyltransferase family 4 protein [Candidatus Anstonellales archaeon]